MNFLIARMSVIREARNGGIIAIKIIFNTLQGLRFLILLVN
jgi:hypothetical protein